MTSPVSAKDVWKLRERLEVLLKMFKPVLTTEAYTKREILCNFGYTQKNRAFFKHKSSITAHFRGDYRQCENALRVMLPFVLSLQNLLQCFFFLFSETSSKAVDSTNRQKAHFLGTRCIFINRLAEI